MHADTFLPQHRQVKPLQFPVPKPAVHAPLAVHGMILAFNKPYGILSQFTKEAPHHRPLAEFGFPPGVYPVGRLDADSEGLLLLSDEKGLTDRLLNPSGRHPRTYWSQVEGTPSETDLRPLELGGLRIRGHCTLPCRARLLRREPAVPPRIPPVRYRASIPTSWDKPPGAAHDRRHRVSHTPASSRQNRKFLPGGTETRRMERTGFPRAKAAHAVI